ncbi:fatty acid desaturase [Erythrobacteraceae bacterium CFH 75059]|nr:fatty acid desaturase [Erythrobacteraceae bacterium CFH 75059]
MQQAIELGTGLAPAAPAAGDGARARRVDYLHSDDRELLRAARDLTRDLGVARPAVYWTDLGLSALLGYGALAGAILATSPWLALACGLVAVLALYRALLFIHELSHVRRDALPGFRLGWNLLVGIPLLTPSFMYEGVHTQHHKRTQYGTRGDPEYLPLALMKPWSLPLFIVMAAFLFIGLMIRFAVLVPLGALVPSVRRLVWTRLSALAINPDYRRGEPDAELRRRVLWQEAGGFAWSWVLIGSGFVIGWTPLLVLVAVVSVVAVLNQLRTLVAHLWENEGEAMTVTAQFLDSVNVPPPGIWAELWAPVGLRYHALHHLMPSMPYHDLPEAHRRLRRELGERSTYDSANHAGMAPLVARIARSTMVVR